MRLTLVPTKHRYNHDVHHRNAFRWSCWDHGEVPCPNRSPSECGNDNLGRRYQQWVKIPPVFPDGDYVLGFAWFGGYGLGTYWSCAEIRIQGGDPVQDRYQPEFVDNRGGKCMSSVTNPWNCRREPCWNPKPMMRVPQEFENGKRPPPLQRSQVLM